MTVVLLDADAAEDTALENSHWVAEQTERRLAQPVRLVRGAGVTRKTVEALLNLREHQGFAYFGHGKDRSLVAPMGAVLELDNLHLIGARCFHAFACNSGNSLAMTACREGVGAYLGYNRPVIVEWTVADLPPEVEEILRRIVTIASLRLQQGERSRRALRHAVRDAYDAWISWRIDHEDADLPLIERLGLDALVRLYDNLEFEGVQVVE